MIRRLFVVCFYLLPILTESGFGQEILVDWANPKNDPICPARVDRAGTATVRVRNLNDIIYEYDVYSRLIPRVINDLGLLLKIESGRTPSPLCVVQVAAAKKFLLAVERSPGLNPIPAGKFISIKRAETVAEWKRVRASEDAKILESAASCETEPEVRTARQIIAIIDKAVVSAGVEVIQIEIRPDTDIEIRVSETLNGVQTAEVVYTCSPASGVLSFSGGLLMTTLPSRKYERQLVPGTTAGTAANNVEQLIVSGNSSVNPAGTVLLNYRLWDNKDGRFGLSLSSGPVFNLSGNPDTSNFGYFGGLSFRLHDRFLITPGAHIGEFADFPAGFAETTPVPANFGQLNPIKRWTLKFGVAFTYATPDFGKARKSVSSAKVYAGGVQPVTTPAKPPAEPAKSIESPPPAVGVGNSNPGSGPPPAQPVKPTP